MPQETTDVGASGGDFRKLVVNQHRGSHHFMRLYCLSGHYSFFVNLSQELANLDLSLDCKPLANKKGSCSDQTA
jgi:hypothetical protein